MAIECLDLADYLLIAEEILGARAEQLASLERAPLAESALHAPAAEFGDVSEEALEEWIQGRLSER